MNSEWIDDDHATTWNASVLLGGVVLYRVTSYIRHVDGEPGISFTTAISGPLLLILENQAKSLATDTLRNRAIKKGLVLLDGAPASSRKQIVNVGCHIECLQHQAQILASSQPLEVVHEDAHMAIVIKQSGLLMDSASKKAGRWTLASLIVHNLEPTPSAVHRLDSSVGGLVACAKTEVAVRELCAAFRGRRVRKTYRAIVVGQLESKDGAIELPINGKPSRTEYNT